jgi:DNA-binding NtrC family response regulator
MAFAVHRSRRTHAFPNMTGPQRSVLVVDSDPADLSDTARLLEGAGYRVATAGAFDEAKLLLASESPDLLITGLRLGPYNGLHLVLRSRTDHPEMVAIVVSRFADPVLEAEAQRHNARYLLRPLADGEFLQAITTSLDVQPRTMNAAESSISSTTSTTST